MELQGFKPEFETNKLKKDFFKVKQLSEREGDLICSISKERVFISGNAVLYLKGEIYI